MPKAIYSRIICDRCGEKEEYAERQESLAEWSPTKAYGLWTYWDSRGFLCEACTQKLNVLINDFFKTPPDGVEADKK